MNRDIWVVRALVSCYPPAWRRRYGDEYAQLLGDMHAHRRPLLVIDSLLGAARAYGGLLMSENSAMTVAVWATGLFTVAGIAFAKLAEDFTGVAPAAYAVVVVASAVAVLALGVAAAPAGAALVRGRDPGAWKYVAVPVVGAAVWYGVLRLAVAMAAGRPGRSGPDVAAFVLIAVTGMAVLAATAWAGATVLRRVPVAGPPRLRPSAVTTMAAAMALATAAALVWGLRVRSADPAGFRGHHGLLATPFVSSWIVVLIALAAAGMLTGRTARRRLTAAG